jgi:LuxR family transcriptional regulator, maltose regulon positive regulatory protein
MDRVGHEPARLHEDRSRATSYASISHIPRQPPYLVVRDRLLRELDKRSSLTLLRAPVGFGKTTLVAQWLAMQPAGAERVAWLRVHPKVGWAPAFWAALLDVLADAGIPRAEGAHHTRLDLAAAAERAIGAADRPVLLVIDGIENIAGPGIDRDLLDLLRYAPRLRLVVSGRSQRHFAAYQRVDLDTTVVPARELLFTRDETAELFAAMSVSLPSSCLDLVQAGSGGWPEPIRSFALAARETELTEGNLVRRAMRIARDYLRQHLLPDVSRTDRIEFALASAVPDELTVDVVEQLTDDRSARAHLDWLEGQWLLISESRAGELVYRWPPAARDALLAELEDRDPHRLRELHRRLARWYLTNNSARAALRHALRSQDWNLLVRVIESSWLELNFLHREELFAALAALPLDVAATSPTVLAVRDMSLAVPDDQLIKAAQLPADADRLAELASAETGPVVLETGYAVVVALRRRGLYEQALGYGERLLDLAGQVRNVRPAESAASYPLLHLAVGRTKLLAGDLTGALPTLRVAYDYAKDDVRGFSESAAAAGLALVHGLLGELREASGWLQRQRAAPPVEGWVTAFIDRVVSGMQLLLATDGLQHAGAGRSAKISPAIDPTEELWPFLLCIKAHHAMTTSRSVDALDELDRLRQSMPPLAPQAEGIVGPLLARIEGNLLLSLGRGNQARAVMSGPFAAHPVLRILHTRLAMLAGDDTGALRLSADSVWDRTAITRDRLEMLLIRAVAAWRTGDVDDAVAAVRNAVQLARAEGLRRAFATVPRAELGAVADLVPAAKQLLAERGVLGQPDIFPSQVVLVQLTEREQIVLDKLAAGLTTRQVADALVVSFNTVKTQQASLYRKLDANSREDALDRARQWGLVLPPRTGSSTG